jgi:hypothetical protein
LTATPNKGATVRHETEHKSFGQADETREFPNGSTEIFSVGASEVGRMTFEPGWRWSNDVKRSPGPIAVRHLTSSTT